jgi:UDP-glucuronate decarboxylase
LIEGFVRLMAAPDEVSQPVNIGNPVETSIAELARLIIDLAGSRSKIEFRPLPADDPVQRCPDISRARSVLGWEPNVPLETGLKRTIAYFDRLLSADEARRSLADSSSPEGRGL